MFSAEPAVLFHFQTVGAVFLVLHGIVITLFALRTSQCNLNSHNDTSYFFTHKKKTSVRSRIIITHDAEKVNGFFNFFILFIILCIISPFSVMLFFYVHHADKPVYRAAGQYFEKKIEKFVFKSRR